MVGGLDLGYFDGLLELGDRIDDLGLGLVLGVLHLVIALETQGLHSPGTYVPA